MSKAVVIHCDEGGDLKQRHFDSVEEAHKFIDEIEWKAYLIIGDNLFTIDRT